MEHYHFPFFSKKPSKIVKGSLISIPISYALYLKKIVTKSDFAPFPYKINLHY